MKASSSDVDVRRRETDCSSVGKSSSSERKSEKEDRGKRHGGLGSEERQEGGE